MLYTEIEFPSSLSPRILGDSILDPKLLNKDIKIIIYTMPLLCSSCNLAVLQYWKILMQELKDEFGDKVAFIYIFEYKKEINLTNALVEFDFNHPVYYDENGEFLKNNNQIPNYPAFHVFLLDKSNKIQFIGNPTSNKKLWNTYKSKVNGLISNY